MITFGQELLGGRGFSIIPSEGLHAIIFTNPWLLLPTKFMLAYARKQSRSIIFEWQEKERGWYLYAGEFPLGWEKRVKVVNLPAPMKKGSVSWTTKPKSAKRSDDSSKTCSDLVPYKGGFPPIGNIVLEGSPPSFACTCSSRCSTTGKPIAFRSKAIRGCTSSNKTHGSKRKTSPLVSSATAERRVCYL